MGSSGWCSTGSSGRHLQSPPQGCKKKTTRHLLCHALQGDGSAGDSIYGGKFKDEPAALKLKWAPAAWLRRACPSQGICCIAPAAHDPPSPLCMKSHPALHLPAHAERPSAPTCMQARWAWSGGLCQLGCVFGLRPIAEQARALHGAVNRAPPLQCSQPCPWCTHCRQAQQHVAVLHHVCRGAAVRRQACGDWQGSWRFRWMVGTQAAACWGCTRYCVCTASGPGDQPANLCRLCYPPRFAGRGGDGCAAADRCG